MRAEGRRSLLLNASVLAAAAFAAWAVLPECGPIGVRNMIFLNMVYVCGMLCFMHWLEKYSDLISGLYEKTVSTALSSIYMFAVTALINLLMFGSAVRLAHDALLCLAGGIFVFGTDALFEDNYEGVEEGLAPDGESELDPYEIQNPVVIQGALEELGLESDDRLSVKGIRQDISISKVVTELDKEVSESAALLGEKYEAAAN